jgi:type II secretory pathway component GspD/PulD (secretin)
MLATLPVEDLGYDDAREHVANCRDCDRVTRVVAERERNMLMAFGELYPAVPAGSIATRAIVLSRRRKIAFYYRVGLGVAGAASILFMIGSRRIAPAPSARVSETFRLQCLSPDQAAEVLRPTVSPSVSISIRTDSPLGIIRVAASPEEMGRVRSVLERYDNSTESQCGVELTVPKVIRMP